MGKYHEILGIEPGADEAAIKKAFRKLAKQYHPDTNPSEEAKAKFIEITEAYEGLKAGRTGPSIDADARQYANDHFSMNWTDIIQRMRQNGTMFNQMHEEALNQTINVIQKMRIPVRKFLQGGEITIEFNTQNFDRPEGMYYKHAKKKLTIPPNCKVGHIIEFPGDGPKNKKGERGNLIVQLFASDDGPYEIQNGVDVIANIQIDPFEIMLGAEKKVLHPDGKRVVVIQIPAGGMPNQIYPQMGMGIEAKTDAGIIIGDMMIQAHPFLPKMNQKQLDVLRKAMEEIRSLENAEDENLTSDEDELDLGS